MSFFNNVISKLQNKHFLSLVGNAIVAFFGILTTYCIFHYLSKSDAGKWFVFMSIISMADAVRNGFLSTATVKFYAGLAQEKGRQMLGSIWFLAIVLTLAASAIGAICLLICWLLSIKEGVMLSFWSIITYISALPFGVIYWKLQADEEYGKMLWLKLVNSGSTLLAFYILMLLHQMTFENALLYNFLTNCLTSIVGIISKMGRLESVFHCKKEYIWNITHFGKFSLATSLSANFLRTSDTFIIAAMLNEEAVAIFNLPVKLMDIIEIPIRSFVATGMSAMAVAHNNNNNEEVTNVLKKYSGMLTMFFIPMAIAVLFLAPLGVSLLGGAKYVHTYSPDIYRLFMFFALLYPIERFTGITLDIINRPQINFYKVILMLALNIAGDALLILLFGNVYGAVVASLIITIAGLWYGHHHLKKHLNYTLLEILQTGYTESLKLLKLKR